MIRRGRQATAARSGEERLIHGFGWSTGYLVITRVASLASVPIALHALGAPLYAVWVLAGALVSIQSLFDLGVAAAMVRYVAVGAAAGSRHAVGVAMRRAMIFYVGLSFVIGVPMWLFAGDLSDLVPYVNAGNRGDAIVIVRWAAVAFGLTNVTIVLSSTLQGIGRVAACYRDQVIGWLAYIPLLVLGIDFWSAAQAVGLAWVGSYALQLVLLGRSLAATYRHIEDGQTEIPRIREMLSFGTRWQVSALADFATFQLPRFAGSLAISANALVGLDVAMRAAQMVAGPILAFYPTVLPRATALLTRGDDAGYRAFLQRYYSLITFAVVAGAAIVIPLEVPALAAWTGREMDTFDPLVGAAVLLGAVTHASTGMLSSGLLAQGDVNSVLVYKGRQLLLAIVVLPLAAVVGLWALAVGVGVVLTLPALAFNAKAARKLGLDRPLQEASVRVLVPWAIVQVALPMAVVLILRGSASAWVLLPITAATAAWCGLLGWWLLQRRLDRVSRLWEPSLGRARTTSS